MSPGGAPHTHNEKVEYMIRDLTKRGVNPYTSAPPLFRLLWKLGVELTPPLFRSFLGTALFMGSFFGAFWGLVMWLLLWHHDSMSLLGAGIVSASAGSLFGGAMGAYYRHKRAKLSLPAWRDYPPAASG